jgi:hypothetical protein
LLQNFKYERGHLGSQSDALKNAHLVKQLPVLTCASLIGAYGYFLCLFWFLLAYDDPTDHPRISISEKDYLTSSLAQQVQHSVLLWHCLDSVSNKAGSIFSSFSDDQ